MPQLPFVQLMGINMPLFVQASPPSAKAVDLDPIEVPIAQRVEAPVKEPIAHEPESIDPEKDHERVVDPTETEAK